MWTKIYENDNEGNAVFGDASEVVEAVRNGAPIRYYVDYYGDGEGIYRDAEVISIKNGVVWVQNNSAVGSSYKPVYYGGDTANVGERLEMTPPVPEIPYPEDGMRYIDDAYHYFEIVSTSGDSDMSRWKVGEHTLHRRNHGHFAMQWFADR